MRIPTVTDEMLDHVIKLAASPVVAEFTSLRPGAAKSRAALELIADEFDDSLIFLRIFQEENPTPTASMRIRSYTTIVIFKHEQEIARMEGHHSGYSIRTVLENAKERGEVK